MPSTNLQQYSDVQAKPFCTSKTCMYLVYLMLEHVLLDLIAHMTIF